MIAFSILVAQVVAAVCVLNAVLICISMKRSFEGLAGLRWMLAAQPFYLYVCLMTKEYGLILLSFLVIGLCWEGFGCRK